MRSTQHGAPMMAVSPVGIGGSFASFECQHLRRRRLRELIGAVWRLHCAVDRHMDVRLRNEALAGEAGRHYRARSGGGPRWTGARQEQGGAVSTASTELRMQPYEVAPDTFVIPWVLEAPPVGCFPMNSLVIRGKEPVIVDTGSPANRAEWLANVSSIVDPEDVKW